jgi:uncharacterized repeat protein (TIGR03843 family)
VEEPIAIGFESAEELLREAEFADCRPLWHSSNYVYLAQLCADEGNQFAAVYKPRRGESPLWDFPDGTLYRREAAAYCLSRLLSWPFVPPTVVREGPHGIGSVQLYIRHDPNAHFFVQREEPVLVEQLQRMAVFDFVANNADRKGGHCLLDEDGRIWGIDHGLCFHEQYKLRTVIWDWADEAIDPALLREVEEAGLQLAAATDDAGPLLELLSPAERSAMLDRIDRLLSHGRFPTPGPHRSYPWPLV